MGKPGQSTSRQEGKVQRPWGRSQHGMFEQHRLFQAKTRQGLKPYWKQSLKSHIADYRIVECFDGGGTSCWENTKSFLISLGDQG